MSPASKIQQIKDGIAALGFDPAIFPVESYADYLAELSRWNKAYNLTAIREFDAMVSHHILDSLSIYPYLAGNRWLDAGTGAGLPGMVLAMAKPEISWILLDSNSKKIRFLNHILLTFNISNVILVHDRVEKYQPECKFDFVVSRAFSNLETFVGKTAHLVVENGKLLAMKGKIQTEELNGITDRDYQVHKIKVPGIKSERNLVVIQ